MTRPIIIAHRGQPGRWENTIRGFLHGISQGADWIEFDVQQAADGELVVFHDAWLGAKRVAACTVEELKERARQLRRIELPTLCEVLEAIPEQIGLGLEGKAAGIARAMVSVLARHRAAERAVCSSFDFPTVRAFADLRPRVRTGILASGRLRDPVSEIRRARADALFQKHMAVNENLIRKVKQSGFQFFVWTVNRERDLRRMVELGVDGIITDYPEKLRKLLQAR